jgi:hypothetical protein
MAPVETLECLGAPTRRKGGRLAFFFRTEVHDRFDDPSSRGFDST